MLNFVVISICLIVASLGIFLLSKVQKLKENDRRSRTTHFFIQVFLNHIVLEELPCVLLSRRGWMRSI